MGDSEGDGDEGDSEGDDEGARSSYFCASSALFCSFFLLTSASFCLRLRSCNTQGNV